MTDPSPASDTSLYLTDEERNLLLQYGAAFANLLGLDLCKSTADLIVDSVLAFETAFNRNAALMRGPKTAEKLEELAKREGTEDKLESTYLPVVSCDLVSEPHNHYQCRLNRG